MPFTNVKLIFESGKRKFCIELTAQEIIVIKEKPSLPPLKWIQADFVPELKNRIDKEVDSGSIGETLFEESVWFEGHVEVEACEKISFGRDITNTLRLRIDDRGGNALIGSISPSSIDHITPQMLNKWRLLIDECTHLVFPRIIENLLKQISAGKQVKIGNTSIDLKGISYVKKGFFFDKVLQVSWNDMRYNTEGANLILFDSKDVPVARHDVQCHSNAVVLPDLIDFMKSRR
jgi:hypothetical protein